MLRTRRSVILLAIGALVLGLTGIWLWQRPAGGDSKVVIGAALPLSGPYAQYGTVPRNAIDLAIEQRMIAKYPYEVVMQYEDTQLRPNLALTAVRKLIDIHRVPVIIGAAGSNETEAVGPVAQKNKVVLISPSSTAASLSKIGDYFFRTIPTDAYEGTFMARFVFKRGVKNVGILAINDTGTKSLGDTFRDEFVRLGGKISNYVLAPKDASDMRTQIAALRTGDPQAVFMVGYANETGIFLRQAAEIGLALPLYSSHPAEAPEVRAIAGSAANGLIFSTPAQGRDSEKGKEFIRAYRSKYGVEPGEFAAEAYDAAMLVLDAIEKVGTQAPAIRDYLHRVRGYEGASGVISFTDSGDVEKPISVMVISDGRIMPFDMKDR